MKQIITGAAIGAAFAISAILYVNAENTTRHRIGHVFLFTACAVVGGLIGAAIRDINSTNDRELQEYRDEAIKAAEFINEKNAEIKKLKELRDTHYAQLKAAESQMREMENRLKIGTKAAEDQATAQKTIQDLKQRIENGMQENAGLARENSRLAKLASERDMYASQLEAAKELVEQKQDELDKVAQMYDERGEAIKSLETRTSALHDELAVTKTNLASARKQLGR
jgi:chromosome segregation ATPase